MKARKRNGIVDAALVAAAFALLVAAITKRESSNDSRATKVTKAHVAYRHSSGGSAGTALMFAPAKERTTPPPQEVAHVRERLRAMSTRDQEVRTLGQPWVGVDTENCQELRTIFDRYGWPKISLWGAQADSDAWLIAQHCPVVAFQQRVLTTLDQLRRVGETRSQNYAFLFDRVTLNETMPDGTVVMNPEGPRKQRYGTQGKCVGSTWQPFDLESPQEIDDLRAEVGLEPMKVYARSIICP